MQVAKKLNYKEQYDKDGIIFPLEVLTNIEVEKYKSCFEKMESHYNGFLPRVGWAHVFFDWAFELVSHPAILEIVRKIIGPEIIVQGSLYLNKYPNSTAFFPWHQDGHYSKLKFSESTTVWLAISESNAENGCMKILPGTHRLDRLDHVEIYNENSLLKNGGEIIEKLDESKARNVILSPGEMSIHQNSIIHGSLPNTSSYRRTGYIIRYSTPAYQDTTPVIQVAGHAPCNHLNVITSPMVPVGGDPYIEHRKFNESRGSKVGE